MISDKSFYFSLTPVKSLKHEKLQLEHSIHLTFLEKEIVVDRYKGLFEAFSKLFSPFCADFKLNEEFRIIKDQSFKVFQLLQSEKQGMAQMIFERDTFMNGFLKLSDLETEFFSQREKIVKVFKERTQAMQVEISKLSEDKNLLTSKFQELEKKYQTCLDEFKEFRKRVRKKLVVFDKSEEKFCKNCQKSFIELENFNWSCRTHISLFNQGCFWCCGSNSKEAPGCIVSKHVSNEENEDVLDQDLQVSKVFCTVRGKKACKTWGHNIQVCHKDPNFRSNFDIYEEMDRVGKIIKNQAKFNENMPKMIGLFESDSEEDFDEIRKLKEECFCETTEICKACRNREKELTTFLEFS
jgi:hypothetical protein